MADGLCKVRLELGEDRKGPTGPEVLQVWLWQYLALAKLCSKVTKFLPLKKQLEIQIVSSGVSPSPLPWQSPLACVFTAPLTFLSLSVLVMVLEDLPQTKHRSRWSPSCWRGSVCTASQPGFQSFSHLTHLMAGGCWSHREGTWEQIYN